MTIIHDRAEVDAYLADLKVRRVWLEHGVRAGEAGASSSTALHPPNDPGARRHADTVAGLRTQAIPHGWEPSNSRNFCTIFNRDSRVAISVMAGDGFTGRTYGTPLSRYPRGPLVSKRIRRNRLEDSMFPDIKSPDEIVEEDCKTWALVQNSAEEGVWAELSLPKSVNKARYVDDYEVRLILGLIEPGGEAGILSIDSPLNPDIDFDVAAR